MADRAQCVPENVEGPFFVDSTCIDCDTCRQIAPATFGETGEFSYVQCQPRDIAEERAAFRALVACPTGSAGAARHRRRTGGISRAGGLPNGLHRGRGQGWR
jgi:hypothetical protein